MLTADKLRKAAILIDSMDADQAEALLSQMPGEQQQAIRNLVVELGEIDDLEREQVISEFLKPKSATIARRKTMSESEDSATRNSTEYPTDMTGLPRSGQQTSSQQTSSQQTSSNFGSLASEQELNSNPGRHNLSAAPFAIGTGDSTQAVPMGSNSSSRPRVDSISENASSQQPPEYLGLGAENREPAALNDFADVSSRDDSTSSSRRFDDPELASWIDQLNDTDPNRLARLLSLERPQTISIILSELDGWQAQQIVKSIERELRCRVLRTMAVLEETPVEISRITPEPFSSSGPERSAPLSIQLASPGIKALERILLAAATDERGHLLDSLREESPDLVERFVALHGWEVLSETEHSTSTSEPNPAILPFPKPEEPTTIENSRRQSAPPKDGFVHHLGAHQVVDQIEAVGGATVTNETCSGIEMKLDSDTSHFPKACLEDSTHLVNQETVRGSDPDQSVAEDAIADHLQSSLERFETDIKLPLEFDELINLSVRSLIAILRNVEPSVAVLSLFGAEKRLLKRLKRGLKRSERIELDRQLSQISTVRVHDIQKCQSAVVQVACEMMEKGEIESLIPKEKST